MPSASSSSLVPLWFFNTMLQVYEPGALNYYTLFCLIPLTLSVFRNLTLIRLPLSGSLDFLLCDLIAPTPGLAFFLPKPRTLVTNLFERIILSRLLFFLESNSILSHRQASFRPWTIYSGLNSVPFSVHFQWV